MRGLSIIGMLILALAGWTPSTTGCASAGPALQIPAVSECALPPVHACCCASGGAEQLAASASGPACHGDPEPSSEPRLACDCDHSAPIPALLPTRPESHDSIWSRAEPMPVAVPPGAVPATLLVAAQTARAGPERPPASAPRAPLRALWLQQQRLLL